MFGMHNWLKPILLRTTDDLRNLFLGNLLLSYSLHVFTNLELYNLKILCKTNLNCFQSWEKCWSVPQAEYDKPERSWGFPYRVPYLGLTPLHRSLNCFEIRFYYYKRYISLNKVKMTVEFFHAAFLNYAKMSEILRNKVRDPRSLDPDFLELWSTT